MSAMIELVERLDQPSGGCELVFPSKILGVSGGKQKNKLHRFVVAKSNQQLGSQLVQSGIAFEKSLTYFFALH